VRVEYSANAELAALQAAGRIAEACREAVQERGRCVIALSGGSTPRGMLAHLARQDVPWQEVIIVQVDERYAPEGHADRNLTDLEHHLAEPAGIPAGNVLVMPVGTGDEDRAAAEYSESLCAAAGSPPVIDVVHLGLGGDGHTASLLPGDALCNERSNYTGNAGVYGGYKRMSLTFPAINLAREVVWLVTGSSKKPALEQLVNGDPGIPASRVRRDNAIIFTDQQGLAGYPGDS
jgi:6-phosphogluconolactonase